MGVPGPHVCSRATVAETWRGCAAERGSVHADRTPLWAPVAGGALTFPSRDQTWPLTAHQGARTSALGPPNFCPERLSTKIRRAQLAGGRTGVRASLHSGALKNLLLPEGDIAAFSGLPCRSQLSFMLQGCGWRDLGSNRLGFRGATFLFWGHFSIMARTVSVSLLRASSQSLALRCSMMEQPSRCQILSLSPHVPFAQRIASLIQFISHGPGCGVTRRSQKHRTHIGACN